MKAIVVTDQAGMSLLERPEPPAARLLQHDAGPGANSETEECFPCVAKREPRDVARGDDAEPDLLELARQQESPLRPPWGIGRIVLGPSVNPDRVFAQHNVNTISLDRPSELSQGLLEPRLVSAGGQLIRRADCSAIRCSNAARFRSATARALSRLPRSMSARASRTDVA